jgi:cohesin complex subunit SA-1/2
MDGVVKDEEQTVTLAKQLATSFIIRGAQLSVVRRLDSRYVVRAHKELIREAVQRVSSLDKTTGAKHKGTSKKRMSVAVGFFRAMVPLLKGMESRDALAM